MMAKRFYTRAHTLCTRILMFLHANFFAFLFTVLCEQYNGCYPSCAIRQCRRNAEQSSEKLFGPYLHARIKRTVPALHRQHRPPTFFNRTESPPRTRFVTRSGFVVIVMYFFIIHRWFVFYTPVILYNKSDDAAAAGAKSLAERPACGEQPTYDYYWIIISTRSPAPGRRSLG